MSDAVINGEVTDNVTVAVEESVQTAATHVGTAQAGFTVVYNSATISYNIGDIFIADVGLYALIGAGNPLVVWAD